MLAAVQVAYPLSNPIPYPAPYPTPILNLNPIPNPISNRRAGGLPSVRRAALARLERRKCGLQLGCAVAACPPPTPTPPIPHPPIDPRACGPQHLRLPKGTPLGSSPWGRAPCAACTGSIIPPHLPLRTAALVARETCYTEPLNELEHTMGGTLDACRMCVGCRDRAASRPRRCIIAPTPRVALPLVSWV